jgi:hypothetical protein
MKLVIVVVVVVQIAPVRVLIAELVDARGEATQIDVVPI